MSDHEFEKQVRQKLDELRLTPSASSWEQIERQIRAERRRRAPLYWLPVLLIGLVAGGYFAIDSYTGKNDLNTQGTPVVAGKVESKPTPQEKSGNGQYAVPGTEKIKEASKPAETASEVNRQRTESINLKERITSNKKTTLSSANQTNQQVAKANAPDVIQTRPRTSSSSKSLAYYSRLHHTVSSQIEKPLSSGFFKNADIPQTLVPGLIQAPPPPPIIPRKKWSFGVSAFAGMSSMNNGNPLNFGANKRNETAAPLNAAFAPTYTPSTIEPGFSYSVGLTVKRELSRRFHLTAGINYLQMNTKNKVGNQVYGAQALNSRNVANQFVRNYFTLEPHKPKDFSNQYHFLEVPLVLHTRFINSQKSPVYWNAGIAYSRLIKSNSLLFDGNTGVYYSNDKLLNKSQASISTGFDFVLFGKSARPLWVGPTAKYNVSSLLTEDVPDNMHFFSLGVNARWFLR